MAWSPEIMLAGVWGRINSWDEGEFYGDVMTPSGESRINKLLLASGNTPQEIKLEIDSIKARYPRTLVSNLESGQMLDYAVGGLGIGLLAAAIKQRNPVLRGALALSGAAAIEFASQDYSDKAAKIRAVKRYIFRKAVN